MKRLFLTRCVIAFLFMPALILQAKAATTMPLVSASALFATGNAFYRGQQYEQARNAYDKLLQAGYDTAPVLYNLGTTNARLGSNTLALAYLSRARNLRPRDENIRANLQFVTPAPPPQEDTDEISASAETLWSRVYGFLTAEEWLAIVWVALMIACAGGAIMLLSRNPRFRAAAQLMIAGGAVVLLVVIVPAATQFYNTRIVQKMIVVDSAELLSGPADRFTRVSNLSEGQVVRSLEHSSEGYLRVRLDNGIQGYAPTQALMQL